VDLRRGRDQRVDGVLRGAAGAQQIEAARPETWIGAMLRDDAADAGGAMGGLGADCRAGGDGDDADLSGSGTAADQGEGHITCISREFNALQGGLAPPHAALSGALLPKPALPHQILPRQVLSLVGFLVGGPLTPDLLPGSALIPDGVGFAAWLARMAARPGRLR